MSHHRLHQIAKLRETLKRWRRQAMMRRNAHSFHDVRTASSSSTRSSALHTRRSLSLPSPSQGRVPAGHLAVCVGEERKRFVIKMSYLSHPLFKALLKKTEEEMGFHHEGALAIPCQVPFFEHLLHLIESHHRSHHHNILNILHLPATRLHHRHHSKDYALPPHYQELLQELLHLLSPPDSTHHSHSSSLGSTHHHSISLCNLTCSLSSPDVSITKGASQPVVA